jgi:hypothetical protein
MPQEDKRLLRELLRSVNKEEIPEEIVVVDNPVPDKIKSEDIFWKTSRIISDEVNRLYNFAEWAGYILAKKDNPTVATNIRIDKELSQASYVRIPAESAARVMDSLEKDLTVVGVIHYFPPLHNFSSTDDRTIKGIAEDIALNTRVVSKYIELQTDLLGLASDFDSPDSSDLYVKEYGRLRKTSRNNLKVHDLSFLIKQSLENGSPKPLLKDFKIFIPKMVGWCYNIIVCDKTVPGSKDNISKCVSVVENYTLSFLPQKIEYYHPIEIDDAIVTGKEIDVENIKKEVKRCVRPSFFESIRYRIISRHDEVETTNEEKPHVEEAKPSEVKVREGRCLSEKEYENFISNLYRFAPQIKESIRQIEETTGLKIYKQSIFDVIPELKKYVEKDLDFAYFVWEVATCNNPSWIEKQVDRYMKGKSLQKS